MSIHNSHRIIVPVEQFNYFKIGSLEIRSVNVLFFQTGVFIKQFELRSILEPRLDHFLL